MEIPYRNSTADSEGQRLSIAGPTGSPPKLIGTTNSSVPSSPKKITSMQSAVSSLINRTRQLSTHRHVFDEMKGSLKRKSSNEIPIPEEALLNNNSSSENANDYRVTVV
jgi:hypothetical protein